MKKYIVFLIIILGCNTKSKDEFENYFIKTKTIELTSHSMPLNEAEANLGYMFNMQYFDSLLFVNDLPDPHYCMKIVDLRNNKVINFAKKGSGPNEMQSQSCDYSIDELHKQLYIRNNTKYYIYSIDSIKNCKYSPISSFQMDLKNKHFLATAYCDGLVFGSKYEKRFGLYNHKTNLSIEKYNYPGKSENTALIFQPFFINHPNKPKVAYFLYNASSMGFISATETDFTINEITNWSPTMEKFKNADEFFYSKNRRNGFISVTADDEYIYVLYSGKLMNVTSVKQLNECFLSNFIYVMDWQGKPINRFKLDQEVRSIAIDRISKTIYAASYEDSCHIVKFKFN